MPSDIFRRLQKVRVAGQQLKISRLSGPGQPHLATKARPGQLKRQQRRVPQAADVGDA
jgi:hypothetical protein